MHVAHRQAQLSKDPPRLVLWKPPSLDEVVEELSSCAELGDEVDVGFGGENLEELTDVGMVETTMVVDFSSEGGGESFGDLLDRASS